jgi:CheY-like chemotaxis protein
MSQAPGPLAGRRVLLVEDEYLIAETMEEWLRMAGAEVPSVAHALALIEGAAPRLDGAVLDVSLGRGETARPIADRLNELGVPFVFATGDLRIIDDRVHRERPRLEKPIRRLQLLATLEALFASRSPTSR